MGEAKGGRPGPARISDFNFGFWALGVQEQLAISGYMTTITSGRQLEWPATIPIPS